MGVAFERAPSERSSARTMGVGIAVAGWKVPGGYPLDVECRLAG